MIWHGERSWNGVALLARGEQPQELRRGLPWDPGDTQSRYLEAHAHGLRVACLYLPNGNPQPSPKFDYKLKWFARLIRHARKLVALKEPVGFYPVSADGLIEAKNFRSRRVTLRRIRGLWNRSM